MAADTLNVRQQASRMDIKKQFYSKRMVDGWNTVSTETVSKWPTKNTEDNWRQPQRVKIVGRTRRVSSWRTPVQLLKFCYCISSVAEPEP
jgi:hypothetical protein